MTVKSCVYIVVAEGNLPNYYRDIVSVHKTEITALLSMDQAESDAASMGEIVEGSDADDSGSDWTVCYDILCKELEP